MMEMGSERRSDLKSVVSGIVCLVRIEFDIIRYYKSNPYRLFDRHNIEEPASLSLSGSQMLRCLDFGSTRLRRMIRTSSCRMGEYSLTDTMERSSGDLWKRLAE